MWTMVAEASQRDPQKSSEALRRLCAVYRDPVLHRLVRQGYGQEAEDLANSFVEHLLERNRFENFVRGKTRFRSFLLECLKRFLHDEWRKQTGVGRGGGDVPIPLDEIEIGRQDELDKALDRQFALTIHNAVISGLSERYEEAGQTERFQKLRRFALGDDPSVLQDDVAKELKMSANAFRKAIFDFRERYFEAFREHVLQTVSRSVVEEEMRYLVTLLADTEAVHDG